MLRVVTSWKECGCNGTFIEDSRGTLELKAETCSECLAAVTEQGINLEEQQLTLFELPQELTHGNENG